MTHEKTVVNLEPLSSLCASVRPFPGARLTRAPTQESLIQVCDPEMAPHLPGLPGEMRTKASKRKAPVRTLALKGPHITHTFSF